MQRLQSWLEGFPLGRGSRERRSRKTSHSAAPTCRAPQPSRSPPRRQPSFLGSKKSRPQPLPIPGPAAPAIYADPWDRPTIPVDFPMGGSLSQSFTRQTIRTNPWIPRDRASTRTTTRSTSKMERSDLSLPSIDRSQLRVKSFEESVCSSGYASQDSSPESSVHSPNWQSARVDKAVECRSIDVDEALGFLEESSSFSPYDNVRDECESNEHIYHELESLTRFSRILDERAYASDSECPSCSSLSRQPSPIYARPYDGPLARPYVEDGPFAPVRGPFSSSPVQRNQLPIGSMIPHSMSTSYPVVEPIYALVKPVRPRVLPVIPQATSLPRRPLPPLLRPQPIRPAPTFCAPPPPPFTIDDELEQAEIDFLTELDAQIAELQMKSEMVRSMVDEARGRHRGRAEGDAWCRARWQQPRFELRL